MNAAAASICKTKSFRHDNSIVNILAILIFYAEVNENADMPDICTDCNRLDAVMQVQIIIIYHVGSQSTAVRITAPLYKLLYTDSIVGNRCRTVPF